MSFTLIFYYLTNIVRIYESFLKNTLHENTLHEIYFRYLSSEIIKIRNLRRKNALHENIQHN
jgi:hypothetical protein